MIAPAQRQSGPPCDALLISLGPLGDVSLHNAVTKRSAALIAEKHRDHYLMFGAAWNGVATRLKAAGIHGAAYRLLFEAEPAAPFDVRFEQDMRLFDAIANAAAAAENALYASYLLAVFPSVPAPTSASLMQPRRVMLDHITRAQRTADLGAALRASFQEASSREMYELRDFLLHRGKPSRNHWVGGEFSGKITIARNIKSHAEEWQNDLILDRESLDVSLDWVSRHCATTARLLAAAM